MGLAGGGIIRGYSGAVGSGRMGGGGLTEEKQPEIFRPARLFVPVLQNSFASRR